MRLPWLVLAAMALPHAASADEPSAPAPEPPAPAPDKPAPAAPPPSAPVEHREDGGADYFPAPTGKDIVLEIPGERSNRDIALCAGLAGGGVVLAGLGVYFNLDSRSAADAVTAHQNSGRVWTPAYAADVTQAHDSAIRAGIGYGVGGALLLASAVMWVITEPKTERRIIHPHGTGKSAPILAPTPGGALLGGQWSF